VLQIIEKRLELEHWKINGTERGGCHFPIMFYTQNMGRRSADANERRKIKAATMQKKTGSSGRAANSSQWHASNSSYWSSKDWSGKTQADSVEAESTAVAAEWRSDWNTSGASNWKSWQ
jgi:hypothetical protein